MTAPISERWKRYEPLVREDLQKAGIDFIPPNLPEILAKLHTGEIIGWKGLFWIGSTGSGKTARMKWVANAFNIPIMGATKLCNLLMEAENEIEREELLHCTPPHWSEIPPHYNDLIIDDLGTEPDGQKVYGTQRDVMVDAILRRYEVFPHWKTHFTSNLTKDDIRARYGERVWSRLNEMCVFITLAGKDRRIGK